MSFQNAIDNKRHFLCLTRVIFYRGNKSVRNVFDVAWDRSTVSSCGDTAEGTKGLVSTLAKRALAPVRLEMMYESVEQCFCRLCKYLKYINAMLFSKWMNALWWSSVGVFGHAPLNCRILIVWTIKCCETCSVGWPLLHEGAIWKIRFEYYPNSLQSVEDLLEVCACTSPMPSLH